MVWGPTSLDNRHAGGRTSDPAEIAQITAASAAAGLAATADEVGEAVLAKVGQAQFVGEERSLPSAFPPW
jgi:hypothetical protein